MKTPPFSGAFQWGKVRRQLLALRDDVQSIRKIAGRNVTVSEHKGKGSVINVARERAAPVGEATGACCVGPDCSITTEAECTELGGVYQGDGTPCDPNPCPEPCTFENLPTHVTGTLDFSGTATCDDGTVCEIVGHYDFDDDLVDFAGSSRRFLGLGVGTATYDCGPPSTCSDPSTLEIEVYVQCSGDNYQIHLFTQTNGVFCCATIPFAYNEGENTNYTPPITSVTFPLDPVTGTGSGTMVLTLT